jgi:hypothetical protein
VTEPERPHTNLPDISADDWDEFKGLLRRGDPAFKIETYDDWLKQVAKWRQEYQKAQMVKVDPAAFNRYIAAAKTIKTTSLNELLVFTCLIANGESY